LSQNYHPDALEGRNLWEILKNHNLTLRFLQMLPCLTFAGD